MNKVKMSIIKNISLISFIVFVLLMLIVVLPHEIIKAEDNYDVIKKDDEIVGVNIKNPLYGAINFDVTGFDSSTGYGVLSIELGEVDTSLSSGLLIKYSTSSEKNMFVRMYIQTSASVVYRLYAGGNVPKRNEVLIRSDGTIDSINNSAANSMHEFNKEGTLYIPWEYAYTAGNNGTQMPAGTKITRLSITRDVRNSSQVGNTLTIGTIGTLKIDGDNAEVVELLDTAKMTYTSDSSDKQANMNLANYAYGKKVFFSKYMTGAQQWGSDSTVFSKVLSLVKLTRNAPKLTINCVDENQKLISSREEKLVFNDTGSEYDLIIEDIDGYLYQSSDKSLTGSILEDTVITLVYKEIPAPVLTIKYIDENNEIIRESESASVSFNAKTGIATFTITPPSLFGFEYVSANKELSGQYTTDTEIELKYHRIYTNFEVVKNNDNEFIGVNLKGSMAGSFVFNVIDIDANTGYGLVSIELDRLDITQSTGLLLKYEVLGSGSVFSRILLEAEDGVLYRLYDDGNRDPREDILVRDNGIITPIATSGTHILTNAGTLYIPWNHLYKVGSSTKPSSSVKFVRLHIGRDLRSESQKDLGIAFGIVAACSVGKTVSVEEIVDFTKLSYTTDAQIDDEDVNLANMTKGKVVNSKGLLLGTQQISDDDAHLLKAQPLYQFTRQNLQLVVNYVDEVGVSIKNPKTVSLEYNSQGSAYSVIPDNIAKYEFQECIGSLSGTTLDNLSITLVYKATSIPELLVKYEDENGNQIADSEYKYVKFNEEDEKYHYSIEPKRIFGYELVSSQSSLTGAITENKEIVLTYSLSFDNYDVVRNEEKQFVGINLKNELTGALVVSVKLTESTIGLTPITIELGNVDPAMSTGLLIQFRVSGVQPIFTRIYIEASDGSLYRFYAGGGIAARDDVLIRPNGDIEYIGNDAMYSRHSLEKDGTLYLPWEYLYKIGNNPDGIEDGVIFNRLHIARELRTSNQLGVELSIGTIAAVKVEEDRVLVEELINLLNLSYTNDKEDTTKDVNFGDISKGKTVYTKMYILGTQKIGTDEDIFRQTLNMVSWKRVPPQITLNFVDQSGKAIRSTMIKNAVFGTETSEYSITIPNILGYEFVSSDKPLTGNCDGNFEITLVYKEVEYVITIKCVDEKGKLIKQYTETGGYGSYHVITPEDIDKYEYLSANGSLKITLNSDKTIILTYAKVGGCKGNISSVSIISLCAFIFVTILVLKKKKESICEK